MSENIRLDGRTCDQLRTITFEPGIAPNATGSVLVSFGNTRVICGATIEKRVPGWMNAQGVEGGWITAEYSMLPYSTHDRKQRDSSKGRVDGRTVEIQRLIGRSMRAALDLKKMPGMTLWIDCDVLQADGGTRTASITGASVAAKIAINRLLADGVLKQNPMEKSVAAVSVGVWQGLEVLDLPYVEDRDADVDFNVVMTSEGEFVEVQGTGEEATFTHAQLDRLLALAKKGIGEISTLQLAALS
ncbi:ribonuclease PH [Cerasicoccus arenae]|uniref:Ribonuclease PH n=1 Tax=Cerasicoccus arenae TaxID=424488 RepID=A0A8J3GEL0_9BACT|nr:ribonuclease PH [Cerasicoccus arenae]GHB99475.1 ribonuclease PH [Cerasicoccus arenae]